MIGLVCLVSLAACCGLAWWQWERFSSANGTFQNLGYVLQWPLFGLFPAFMFWRMRRLRQADTDGTAESTIEADEATTNGAEPACDDRPTRIDPEPATANGPRYAEDLYAEDDEDDEHDEELAEYNRYLAELNRTEEPVRGLRRSH